MRKLVLIDLILFALILIISLSPVEGSLRKTLALPASPGTIGKVLKPNGTVTIDRRNVKKKLVVKGTVPLVLGDTLIIGDSSTVRVVCFSPYKVMDLATGNYPSICQPAGDLTDDFSDFYKPKPVKIIEGPGGGYIEPRANDYPKVLAVILIARPEYLGSSISLKKFFPNDMFLSNDKRSEIIDRINAIPNISDDEKRLLRADVLAMNGLYEPAIDELKEIANAANDPFIQINLGDLFLAANLSGHAKRAYSSAIRAAVAANDIFGEALAQHALGMLLKFEGSKVSEASLALKRAILLYGELGETSIADSLQSELESLQSSPQSAPKPVIKNILPTEAVIGGTAFTLIVNGTGYIPGSVVNWNGTPRQTTFISSTQLQVEITPTDIAVTGNIKVTVTNPPPRGRTSNSQTFTVQTINNNR